MNELSGKRVFVVEDDPANLAVLVATLRNAAAAVFQDSINIDVARRVLQYLPIDVILLDIMLRQGIDGYDVFDKLRANPQTAHIPVVAVTVLDSAVQIPKARAKGLAGYVGKPINNQALITQLAELFGKKRNWIQVIE